MRDPTDIRGQERDQQAAEARDAHAARVEVEDLKWLMGHKQGRRHVFRVLERAGVYRTSFNTNASVTAFNEGRRDMGLWLTAQVLEHAPEAHVLMLKEHKPNDD